MTRRSLVSSIRLSGFLMVVAVLLGGCASIHASPDGPGDCVGPPSFCTPYFGS